MESRPFARLGFVCLLAGLAVLVGAVAAPVAGAPDSTATAPTPSTQQGETANGSNASVGVGQQLATVVAVSRHQVQTGVEQVSFTSAFESATPRERAALIADRARELANQTASLRATQRDLRAAYEAGEIGELTYAQRSAVLGARATDALASVERLQARARNVSAARLRAAGTNRSSLRSLADELDRITGTGYRALLARFTGERAGDVDIEAEGETFEITVESEDGERSREFERQGDENSTLAVSRSVALATARSALGDVDGRWTLTRSRTDRDDGQYTFAFTVRTNTTVGEAEVSVDGSTGEVVALEEELEPRSVDDPADEDEQVDDPADEDEQVDDPADGDEQVDDPADGDEQVDGRTDEGNGTDDGPRTVGNLTMAVTRGTPGPGETVTVTVLADGEPAGNVTVTRDGEAVGTTGADGTIRVTLLREETTLEAEYRDADAKLRFEFASEGDTESTDENDAGAATAATLDVDATYRDGRVSVTVTRNGSGVGGVAVEANGEAVGSTAADGTVTFPIATDRLELELTDGETDVERTYEVRDGTLVPVDD